MRVATPTTFRGVAPRPSLRGGGRSSLRSARSLLLALAALPVVAAPTAAQSEARWYWGVHAGSLLYQTTLLDWKSAPEVGVHWLITKRRTGLYVAVDQMFFQDRRGISSVENPFSPTGSTRAGFTRGRRYQASIYGIPLDSKVQTYLGVGLAIQHLTDADTVDIVSASPQEIAFASASIESGGAPI